MRDMLHDIHGQANGAAQADGHAQDASSVA
jgi:hypothetical protein